MRDCLGSVWRTATTPPVSPLLKLIEVTMSAGTRVGHSQERIGIAKEWPTN